ncbi:hypothetical protein K438DRAFT_2027347 [Mycena galopus ATCC 62051]|nr:hypothetical protein K438DRAFT_2027347 [Mycena galopus ATCC 62051]
MVAYNGPIAIVMRKFATRARGHYKGPTSATNDVQDLSQTFDHCPLHCVPHIQSHHHRLLAATPCPPHLSHPMDQFTDIFTTVAVSAEDMTDLPLDEDTKNSPRTSAHCDLRNLPRHFYHSSSANSISIILSLIHFPYPMAVDEFTAIFMPTAIGSEPYPMDEFTDIFTPDAIVSEPPTDAPVDGDTPIGYGSGYCVIA